MYRKSQRDFLFRPICKIPYRLRNAACHPLQVLLASSLSLLVHLLHFLYRYHYAKRKEYQDYPSLSTLSLILFTIGETTTTTWPESLKIESKTNGKAC